MKISEITEAMPIVKPIYEKPIGALPKDSVNGFEGLSVPVPITNRDYWVEISTNKGTIKESLAFRPKPNGKWEYFLRVERVPSISELETGSPNAHKVLINNDWRSYY